ncbi:MAG: peptidylprolyl isomerase [Acidimicrobiia bacterium]|nr:peptidylprolyl isomerase [Acidimicrobiia bacterium]
MRRLPLPLLALLLLAAACGGDDPGSDTTSAPASDTITTEAYLRFRAQPTACGSEAPPPARDLAFDEPADLGLAGTVTATIVTSCGDVVVELDADVAPATVNSFVFLAESGYFDGTVSHRVVPDFVVQAGDPTATGRGGPGYVVPDEFATTDIAEVDTTVVDGQDFLTFADGSIAMANAGPGTTGSQWFITLEDVPLPPQFTWFGRVVDGFDTLQRIEELPLAQGAGSLERSLPLETLYIETVTVER